MGDAAVIPQLAGDGWRFRVACARGCGGTAVTVLGHVPDARCGSCARLGHGAPVVTRSSADRRMRLGQGGAACYPVRRSTGAVSLVKSRIVRSQEVGVDDPRLPPAARSLAGRTPGARVLLSVARRASEPRLVGWGKLDAWVSVQWRLGPGTVIAAWKNGRREYAMIGGVKTTHTDAGAI